MNTQDNDIYTLFDEKGTAEPQTVEMISVKKIHPFLGHPFKILENEDLQKLIESIRENGIMTPLLLRKDGAVYELISGHRRYKAATELKMEYVPAIVSNISHEEAIITMVDSNLSREHITISEKAYAYKMKYEALAKRESPCQVGTGQRTDKLLAENSNDSARQIQRYIRLTKLISSIMKMVDANDIPFTVGVELSYLDTASQMILYEVIAALKVKPSLAQAKQIHKDFNDGKLSKESIENLLRKDKPIKQPALRLPLNQFDKFLNKFKTDNDKIKFLLSACEFYVKNSE